MEKMIASRSDAVAISDGSKITVIERDVYNELLGLPQEKCVRVNNIKNNNICIVLYNNIVFSNDNCLYELSNDNIKEIFKFPSNHYIKKLSFDEECLYILCETTFGNVVYFKNYRLETNIKKLNIPYDDIDDIIVDCSNKTNMVILKRYNGFLIKNNESLDLKEKYNIPKKNDDFISIYGVSAKKILINKDIYIIDDNNYCYILKKDISPIMYPHYKYDNKIYLDIGKVLDVCSYKMELFFIDLDGNLKCFCLEKEDILSNVKFKKIVKIRDGILFISKDDIIYKLEEDILPDLQYEEDGGLFKVVV